MEEHDCSQQASRLVDLDFSTVEELIVSYMLKNLGESLEAALGRRKTGLSAGSMGESIKKTKSEESRREEVCHGTNRSLAEGKLELMPKQADRTSLQRADLTSDHMHLIQWSRVQHL